MTPAIVTARRAGLHFELHEYAHEPAAGSYALEAAEELEIEPARVFKTLVAAVDGRLTVALVPADRSLDLKALAASVGGKRAAMAAVEAAERATGYVAGGISPLGQRRRLPTVLDRSALDWETIFVSGGRRGLELELRPKELQDHLQAKLGSIAR